MAISLVMAAPPRAGHSSCRTISAPTLYCIRFSWLQFKVRTITELNTPIDRVKIRNIEIVRLPAPPREIWERVR